VNSARNGYPVPEPDGYLSESASINAEKCHKNYSHQMPDFSFIMHQIQVRLEKLTVFPRQNVVSIFTFCYTTLQCTETNVTGKTSKFEAQQFFAIYTVFNSNFHTYIF